MLGWKYMLSKISSIGLVVLVLLVVFVSGCISLPNPNEKVIGEFNFPKDPNEGNSTQKTLSLYNVTIPEGAKSVKIETQNMAPTPYATGEDLNKTASVYVWAFEVVPSGNQSPTNFSLAGMVNQQSVYSTGVTQKGGTLFNYLVQFYIDHVGSGPTELKSTDIKGLLIRGDNVKGKVKVIVTT